VTILQFTVPGKAEPRGSKTIGKTTSGRAFIRDDNAKSKNFMSHVADHAFLAAYAASLKPVTDAIGMEVVIYRARPKGHHGKRGLLPSAPPFPGTKPDLTKVIRGIEDACKGIVFADDSLICEHKTRKAWGSPERTEVRFYRLEVTA